MGLIYGYLSIDIVELDHSLLKNRSKILSKPLIKWVGGKRQLIEQIKKYMPQNFNNYVEPFVGGGALFFELKKNNSIINDFNAELTNLYEIVKSKPNELIKDLKKHKTTEDYYYTIRELDRKDSYKKLSKIKKASRFIYLNRMGYNGLYRVNSKGYNNVPFGKYINPMILDESNILSCSRILQTTTILTGDFEQVKPYIKKGDFVYLDPPYVPVSSTANFTSYTPQGFDFNMQIRLKFFCDYIHSIGAYFMLSNSYTDLILELYSDYTIKTVEASRALNCKSSGRGKVNEVLVFNYVKEVIK